MSGSFTKVYGQDRALNQVQRNVEQAIGFLLKNPLTHGYLLPKLSLVSGDNSIAHGLNRPVQGWFIVRRRRLVIGSTPTAYDIYDTQDSNDHPDQTLSLTCSAGTPSNPVIVDLYCF